MLQEQLESRSGSPMITEHNDRLLLVLILFLCYVFPQDRFSIQRINEGSSIMETIIKITDAVKRIVSKLSLIMSIWSCGAIQYVGENGSGKTVLPSHRLDPLDSEVLKSVERSGQRLIIRRSGVIIDTLDSCHDTQSYLKMLASLQTRPG